MPRVVVLGTGTGVGKTYVTAALARALVRAHPAASVLALKPVETGLARRRGQLAPPIGSDAAVLEGASNTRTSRPHPLYAFRDPVSPHLAARRENARISLSAIGKWVDVASYGHALHAVSWTLVETAGGAFSPVTRGLTNVDLAAALGPAIWLLVAPDSLGVFHDARATLLALEAAGRSPDYLVLSSARTPDVTTGTNRAEFRRLGLPYPVAVLGRGKRPESALAPLVRALLRRSANNL